MSNLKNAIKRIESGILYTGLGGVDCEDIRAVVAAAKTTLPKTVKKWDVQASHGADTTVKHGASGFLLYPYEQKENAIKFATKLIELGWHNVSVVEVEVED